MALDDRNTKSTTESGSASSPTDKSANYTPKKTSLIPCKVCGAALPRGVERCVICGTKRGSKEALHSPPSVAPEDEHKPSTPSHFRRNRTRIAGIASILAFLLILSSLGVGVFEYTTYQSLLSRYTLGNSLLYQQGGNTLKLSLATIAQPFDLTDRFQSSSSALTAKESADLRFLGYLNNQRNLDKGVAGNLYLLDLLALSPEYSQPSEGLLVTKEQVVDFRFLPKKESLIYLTTMGELYLADYGALTSLLGSRTISSTLLDSEVKGIGSIAESQVLYYKGESADRTSFEANHNTHSGNSFDLYSLELIERRKKPVLVATNVYSVLDFTKTHERIIYTKRTHIPPLVQYEVYLYSPLAEEESTLLASNVWHIVDADADKGNLLYLSPLQDMLRFEDLFDDDLLAQDDINRATAAAAAQQPPTEETLAATPEKTDTPLPPEEDILEEEEDAIIDTSEEMLPTNPEIPDTAMTEAAQRLLRDKFRAHLKSSIRDEKQRSYLSFDLYQYNGSTKENKRLAGPIYNWDNPEKLVYSEEDSDFVLFVESNPNPTNRQRISDFTTSDLELFLEQPFELFPFLAEHMPDTLYHLSLSTGEIHKLFSEPGSRYISNYYVTPESTPNQADVYFISYPDFSSTTGTLYHTPLVGGFSDKVIHQDEDVEAIIGKTGGETPRLIYQTASRDNPPTRNIYGSSSAGITEIATNTSAAEYIQLLGKNQQIIAFFRNYNLISKTGDLFVYQKEEEHFIASDISSAAAHNWDVLFLIRRESNSFRSLYEYRDGEFVLLDERLGAYQLFTKEE